MFEMDKTKWLGIKKNIFMIETDKMKHLHLGDCRQDKQ